MTNKKVTNTLFFSNAVQKVTKENKKSVDEFAVQSTQAIKEVKDIGYYVKVT